MIDLEKLHERYVRSQSHIPRPANGPILDVPAYLAHYGIAMTGTKRNGTSILYMLGACVFNPNHKGKDAAIVQDDNGALSYKCFHESCKGKKWKDARQIISEDESLESFFNGKTKRKRSLADDLISLAIDHIKLLFIDQYKEPYVVISRDNHNEVIPIKGSSFRLWLQGLYFSTSGHACNAEAIKSAIETLEAKAQFKGAGLIKLHNRVAWHNGELWYDLSDEEWLAIHITSDSWEIVKDSPTLFRRYKNQIPQLQPLKEGNLDLLFDFINITDEKSKLLIKVWIAASFIPDFPHPILIISGAQGSAKTYFFKLLKLLIDPGTKQTDSLPSKPEDLIKKLNNNYTTFLDNLGQIPNWSSDIICRAITGEGYSERKLYTNNEEEILSFKRVVGLNGINLAASQPDILDRSITIELERIPPEKRRSEQEIDARFKEALPEILGGIFYSLSKTYKLYPEAKLKMSGRLPRMADFAEYGYAIAEALGNQGEEFIEAYNDNIGILHNKVVSEDPIAITLKQFMLDKKKWEGSSHYLLKELNDIASMLRINIYDKQVWPQQGKILTKKMNVLKTNLNEIGISIETSIHTEQGNIVRIVNNNYRSNYYNVDDFALDLTPEKKYGKSLEDAPETISNNSKNPEDELFDLSEDEDFV